MENEKQKDNSKLLNMEKFKSKKNKGSILAAWALNSNRKQQKEQ